MAPVRLQETYKAYASIEASTGSHLSTDGRKLSGV